MRKLAVIALATFAAVIGILTITLGSSAANSSPSISSRSPAERSLAVKSVLSAVMSSPLLKSARCDVRTASVCGQKPCRQYVQAHALSKTQAQTDRTCATRQPAKRQFIASSL